MRGEKEEKRKDDKGGVEWSHTGKGWCVCVCDCTAEGKDY